MYRILLLFCLFTCIKTEAQRLYDSNVLLEKAKENLRSSPDSAFYYAKQLRAKSSFENNELLYAQSLQILAEIFFSQGLYSEALENLFESENIFIRFNDRPAIAENVNLQALVYYNNKQAHLALEHHLEALEIYLELQDSSGIAYTLGCIGRQYEKRGEYDEALKFQNQAKDIYQKITDQEGLATILENIASIYEDKEEYDQALWYYNMSLDLAMQNGDSLLVILNLNNIGDIGRKTGNLQTALEYGAKALSMAERSNSLYQQSAAHRDLAKVFELMGNLTNAVFHLNRSKELYDEMYSSETIRQTTLWQAMFEMERKNHEILLLENQQKINALTERILYSGILIVLVLSFVFFRHQKLKMRRKQEASEIETKLLQANNTLMQQKLDLQKLEEQRLQDELEIKSKNLTAHTLHLIGKNKILEEVKDQLRDIIDNDKRNLSLRLSKLTKQIEININQDKDWEDFSTIFQSVHQDYFDKLNVLCNDLTPSELRLAALIRLNLPTKDMATLLGISSDSLRIARYRLKKKLRLSAETSLSNFLITL